MKIKNIIAGDSVRINAEYNGDKFWFEARTNALSPRFLQQLREAETRPTELASALADVITDWEGSDELAPTVDVLERLPMDFISVLLDALTGVWQGNAQKPSGSASGSAVAAK